MNLIDDILIISANLFILLFVLTFIILILKVIRRTITNHMRDKKLNINTTGTRRIKGQHVYNRTESTPYLALDSLHANYQLKPNSRIVDYGAGKGRVTIYLNKLYGVPVTGIEINEKSLEDAEKNLVDYEEESKDNDSTVYFHYGYAETYSVHKNDNVFFFFNPFQPIIFEQVIRNIVRSSEKHQKDIDVILYYKINEFGAILESFGFELIEKTNTKGMISEREKLYLYRKLV